MEGESVKAKISYFHHWIDSPGMADIESGKNNKTLISQEDYEKLEENEKEEKYSLGEIESCFTLFESLLSPKSNPLLAVEELHFVKQISMNSGEFYSHVTKIVKRCQFPNAQAEERAIRDAIFLEMNSQKARDKAINLLNEEGKVLTVDFLMNQLEIEDCNSHCKSLSQLDSTSSVNFAAYDHRQNKGKKSRKNRGNGKEWAQNKPGVQGPYNSGHHSRKSPGMEGKCMRYGKLDHQPGQRCPAKNAKCKECHKIGHFHKVCQSKKRATHRAHLATVSQNEDDTHTDELGDRQPNPSRVNMLKAVNHIEVNTGKFSEGKHLKFPIASHPRGPYNHHIIVRVDTGADVNCMNEKTFSELFPEVQLSVCSHGIQNFGNTTADIPLLGQFCTYLESQMPMTGKFSESWCHLQDGCTSSQVPQGHGC